MSLQVITVFLLLVPVLTSAFLTVGIEGICHRLNLFDLPGERKMQVLPVPRLGGAAFFITSVIFAALFSLGTTFTHMMGAFVVFVGGFIDDVYPRNSVKGKLLFQIPAAIIFAYGCPIEFLVNHAWQAILLRVALFGFVFFMTNATNLMDNMDGLAAGTSVIILATLSALGLFQAHDLTFSLLGLLVAAATLGFLLRNFPSGKIYMGDQGSQFLGYFTSSYAILLFIKCAKLDPKLGVMSFVIPAAILFGLFLYDVSLVVAIRVSEGRSPFVGDQCHVSHQLVRRGFSPRIAVLILLMIQMGLSILAFRLFP